MKKNFVFLLLLFSTNIFAISPEVFQSQVRPQLIAINDLYQDLLLELIPATNKLAQNAIVCFKKNTKSSNCQAELYALQTNPLFKKNSPNDIHILSLIESSNRHLSNPALSRHFFQQAILYHLEKDVVSDALDAELNYFYPVYKIIYSEMPNMHLAQNYKQYDFFWNQFNLKLTKRKKDTPKQAIHLLDAIQNRWNDVMRTIQQL
jgi:hypothetical protein